MSCDVIVINVYDTHGFLRRAVQYMLSFLFGCARSPCSGRMLVCATCACMNCMNYSKRELYTIQNTQTWTTMSHYIRQSMYPCVRRQSAPSLIISSSKCVCQMSAFDQTIMADIDEPVSEISTTTKCRKICVRKRKITNICAFSSVGTELAIVNAFGVRRVVAMSNDYAGTVETVKKCVPLECARVACMCACVRQCSAASGIIRTSRTPLSMYIGRICAGPCHTRTSIGIVIRSTEISGFAGGHIQ